MTPATAVRLPRHHAHLPREGTSRSSNETSLTSSTGTAWSHVWNNFDLDDYETGVTNLRSSTNEQQATSSWQEEAHWMSFRHAVQQFASLKPTKEEEEEVEVEEESPRAKAPSPAPSDGAASGVSSLTSDLAETKMRLALAQAERDELEFALLQREAS